MLEIVGRGGEKGVGTGSGDEGSIRESGNGKEEDCRKEASQSCKVSFAGR